MNANPATPDFSLPAPGTVLSADQAMHLALDAARQGIRGANPLVGAVIVDADSALLSVGWHRGAGTAHAEADALAKAHQAGIDVRGAHMFVSLEPCNHTGRTGPCSHAIAQADIARVTFAYADSTDDAAGGAAYLRQQGIAVHQGLLSQESEALNARWFAAAQRRRPFTTAKIASTLDGKIAAADGTSQWITGAPSRADGHLIRARADAVLAGTGTVVADDPALTARDAQGAPFAKQPRAVVMGNRDIPESAQLASASNTLHLRSHDPLEVAGALYEHGVRHLMIEGGPTVLSAFLAADLVDEIFWYQAPKILGAGRSAVADWGISTLRGASEWQLDDLGMSPAISTLGTDARMHLVPQSKR